MTKKLLNESTVRRFMKMADLAPLSESFIEEKVNEGEEEITENDKILLCDAQTSGGLLISINPNKADILQKLLSETGTLSNQIIGEVYSPSENDPTIQVTG